MRRANAAVCLLVFLSMSCFHHPTVTRSSLKRANNADALFVEEGVVVVKTEFVLSSHDPIEVPASAVIYLWSDLMGLNPTEPYLDPFIEAVRREMAKSGYVVITHRDVGKVHLSGHPKDSQVEVLIHGIEGRKAQEIVALDLSEHQ